MKKAIGVAFGFVGTVIGAGFASGKEVALYFAGTGILTPLLAGVLLGGMAYLFCEIGRRTGGETYALFGMLKRPFSALIKITNGLVFCTTIAACEEIIFMLFGMHGGSIMTVGLTLCTLFIHKKITVYATVLSVISIIVIVAVLSVKTDKRVPDGVFSPLSAFLYAGMNMLTGGFFISGQCRKYTKRQSVITAVIAGASVSGLLILVYFLCADRGGEVFPLVTVATTADMRTASLVLLFLAMYTTCIGTSVVATGRKIERTLVLCVLSLGIGCFGFEKLITTIYPMIGAVGCATVFICCALYFYRRLRHDNLDILVSNDTDKSIFKRFHPHHGEV